MKLTKNFNLDEFQCKCGCKMPFNVEKNIRELAENLQVLRNKVGGLTLTNAYRCAKHNAKVGGVKNSQHVKGVAADLQSKLLKPSEIANAIDNLMKLKEFKAGGIGRYNTFTHVDIRGTIANWNNTTK